MDADEGTDRFDPGVLIEASMDAQGTLTSDPRIDRQGPRPGQSANRDRTQSWWDVLPIVSNVGCRVSCAVLPAIVAWVSTLSGFVICQSCAPVLLA